MTHGEPISGIPHPTFLPCVERPLRLSAACSCSLHREVLYHGRLFISENYLCFHSSVLLKDTKVTDASSGSTADVQIRNLSLHPSNR